MKSITTNSVEETYELARDFVRDEIGKNRIICLQGDLGAGKTTFTQGVLSELGAQKPYTSPTFNIVKEYDVDKYGIEKVYHIDVYRIGSEDMESIGWHDIVKDDKALVVIEWPENIKDILPSKVNVVLCEMIDKDKHKYTFGVSKLI